MENTSNNVIEFPIKNINIIKHEDVDINMLTVKLNHINETLALVLPLVFNNLELAGFNLEPENEDNNDINIKDGTLIVESLRSLLCKYYGLYHPFQDIADNVFLDDDDLTITDFINIKFKTGV